MWLISPRDTLCPHSLQIVILDPVSKTFLFLLGEHEANERNLHYIEYLNVFLPPFKSHSRIFFSSSVSHAVSRRILISVPFVVYDERKRKKKRIRVRVISWLYTQAFIIKQQRCSTNSLQLMVHLLRISHSSSNTLATFAFLPWD